MSSLLLLFVCFAAGALVSRYTHPPVGLARGLNWWVLNIAFSGLVLHLIPKITLAWEFWFLIAAMALVFLGAWAVFELIGRALQWPPARIGTLILVAGLGNTAFIGLPLIEALRGTEAVALALIADQAGTFFVLAVGGTTVAAIYSGDHVNPRVVARKIFFFPPFLCLLLGLAVGTFGAWPAPLDEVFARLGQTLVPLALFAAGLQLRLEMGPGQFQAVALGLGWKLLIAPTLVCLIGLMAGVGGLVFVVGILQAAMAPMISATILVEQYDLESSLALSLLGSGILLSFLTVPLIDYLLRASFDL
jgi:predicted permease